MTNELDWLAERQPPAAAPDPTTTAAARAALLDHVDGRPWSAPPAPARRVSWRRVAALSLATAAAVTVAAVGLPFGGGDDPQLQVATDRVAPLTLASADAAPLRRLSARVAALPDQPGDATLSVHTNRLADGHVFTGADLYLDDGTYYYAPTRAELAGLSGETPVDMPMGAIIAATRRAATLGPEEARQGFLRASEFPVETKLVDAPEGLKKRAEHAQRVPVEERPSLREREDNMIWVTAIDVLAAGGSRPDVRAGVLRLLATVPSVTLDSVAQDGRRLLRLRSNERGYRGVLYLDADTGVMQRYEGGVAAGGRPDVVVGYDIRRVDAAQVRGR
ncbi:hypothetical protein Q5424_11800 [Conexibacter sp. JD483]|uniref:hypothetical protein n=1 Tax=unclassified Conexibacter TaxID=2627773 RepID=UPI00271F105D|nr:MULTISPECIES: hypothetical protein [unclassified Conexibacter]MDO8187865.1 hypothetical protein [Conexibacter sp. CPCC 205706]MDO8201217.1 hypothetical protein [Conexibacter sp. CPCC 205762]MDR9369771.1 hypothetical protein [Conexibacter sp. JD483]